MPVVNPRLVLSALVAAGMLCSCAAKTPPPAAPVQATEQSESAQPPVAQEPPAEQVQRAQPPAKEVEAEAEVKAGEPATPPEQTAPEVTGASAKVDATPDAGPPAAKTSTKTADPPAKTEAAKTGTAKTGTEKAGTEKTTPDKTAKPPAETAAAPAKVAAPEKKLERLWKAKCSSCHGPDGKAQTAKGKKMAMDDMTQPKWQAARTDAQLLKAIRDGVSTERGGVKKEMDPYKDDLGKEEQDGLVQVVRWLGQAK